MQYIFKIIRKTSGAVEGSLVIHAKNETEADDLAFMMIDQGIFKIQLCK